MDAPASGIIGLDFTWPTCMSQTSHLHCADPSVDLVLPGGAARPAAAVELHSSFNCLDTEENGILGAAEGVNVTSDSSIAVLLCNLLMPRLTWLPPIEWFTLAVTLTLSLHH